MPHELGAIIDQMETCLDKGLHYPALLVALTLPDICAALELPPGTDVTREHYRQFVQSRAEIADLGCDPEDCYRLRCGVVHRGTANGHRESPYTHVIFSTDLSSPAHSIRQRVGENYALMIDLRQFCKEMTRAVARWWVWQHGRPEVQANLPRLLSLRSSCPPFAHHFVIASGE